jgi:hypothetical protein
MSDQAPPAELVLVPRAALELVLENLEGDVGPPGERWFSDELREARARLERALAGEADSL